MCCFFGMIYFWYDYVFLHQKVSFALFTFLPPSCLLICWKTSSHHYICITITIYVCITISKNFELWAILNSTWFNLTVDVFLWIWMIVCFVSVLVTQNLVLCCYFYWIFGFTLTKGIWCNGRLLCLSSCTPPPPFQSQTSICLLCSFVHLFLVYPFLFGN